MAANCVCYWEDAATLPTACSLFAVCCGKHAAHKSCCGGLSQASS